MRHFSFTAADPEYYEPFEVALPGRVYLPSDPPAGWTRLGTGAWTMWLPPSGELADQGWKVHVSSSLENTQRVLDTVSGVCAELAVPFKHMAGQRIFLWMHEKQGNRAQAGKFCAAYPASPEIADALMAKLEGALADLAGCYVLSDRRFGSSRCVSYRYGAFKESYALQPDGTKTPTMRDVNGQQIPDERRPEFLLPAGLADPFAPPPESAADGPAAFGGYTFDGVVQHGNGGGSYRAHAADGTVVFIKEARAHTAYTPDGSDAIARLRAEHRALQEIHAAHPGLCPAPVELFDYWENSYLATEFVDGQTLLRWIVANMTAIRVDSPPDAYAGYYRRCQAILGQLRDSVTALHQLGYVFVDLNPRNILIDSDDRARLVDFEAAQRIGSRIRFIGVPGYLPPEARSQDTLDELDPVHIDEYALSAIALTMLLPLHGVVERSPEVLAHLHHDLSRNAPVPAALWEQATRFYVRPQTPALPAPKEVADAPLTALAWLRDRTADRLERMARHDNPRWIYPTTPQGLLSNTRCVAHGTAGVLHALRFAGRPADPAIVRRLRDESLAQRDDTPPGLLFGNAGIAWVLADLGQAEAAAQLLAAADSHPLASRHATLGGGAAGIALAHLSFYCRTGDGRHLDAAWRLLDTLPHGAGLTGALGPDDAFGLAEGRAGIALALYYLSRLSGDDAVLARGTGLLREELRRALPMEYDAIAFCPSARDRRRSPYLWAGSAGYAHTVIRYLTVTEDPALAESLRQCLRTCTIRHTVYAGLFQGIAGFGLVLGEAARLLGRPDLAIAETGAGTALFKYAVPDATGVRFLGDAGMRFSADLWSGSAGILLTLQRMLSQSPDPLFTLDAAVTAAAGRSPVGVPPFPVPAGARGR